MNPSKGIFSSRAFFSYLKNYFFFFLSRADGEIEITGSAGQMILQCTVCTSGRNEACDGNALRASDLD